MHACSNARICLLRLCRQRNAFQLLGRWPGDKYLLSYEEVAAAKASVCSAEVVVALDLFRQICFAWLTGNGDVHAKNISVVKLLSGLWSLSLAYDLVSTLVLGCSMVIIPWR